MLRKLAWALANLTWVSAGFGWLSLVAPIIIASPMYFSGQLTFGGLMMAVGAFNQVNQALRWYVINFRRHRRLAGRRLTRVSSFRNALLAMDTPANEGEVIAFREATPEEGISLCNLSVYGEPERGEAGHGIRMREGECVIRPGERVMINGDPGADRHLFFQAVARIWPWGAASEIALPPSAGMIMMPQDGYMPTAALREVMTYPAGLAGVTDEALVDALEKAGLERLTDRLDEVERWDRLLDKDEEASLAIANAVLRKPEWLIMDDVLEGLEPETRERLLSVLDTLEKTTIVYIGRSEDFVRKILAESFPSGAAAAVCGPSRRS